MAPPASPEKLADALERLIADADLRRRFSTESRRIAETTFSKDHVLSATLALYEKLLRQLSPRR